jgi:hypothetical protein
MSGSGDKPGRFVPDLGAVCHELSDSLKGWAKRLGIEASYYDGRVEEGGSNDWGDQLDKATQGVMKTVVSLLTARGKMDTATDLRQRLEGLYAQGQAYQQRLEALEDQRRVHVEGLLAQYRRKIDDDPDQTRLRALCKGPQRVWTLRLDERPPEAPEEFAEAIDKASWEEEGGKLKAQSEMKRAALDLAEHVELLADKLIRADRIEMRRPDWLLRGMLERDTLALIFGDPGSGKSFLAIDWACRAGMRQSTRYNVLAKLHGQGAVVVDGDALATA